VARPITKAAAGVFLALGLASCASVSVEDGTERVIQTKPEIIYVANFQTESAEFKVDRTGRELADFKKNLQEILNVAMTTDLTDRLAPAVRGMKSSKTRLKNAWLIRGEFVTVKQGSRLLRGAIGFGAGGTKEETRVQVYDLAQAWDTPFLTFTTTGGSGAEPGAILALSTDPLELAIGGISGVAHGLDEDTKRTAREITAELSNYMYKRGWVSTDQWIEPKRPRETEESW
jgi:hypothetical protein